MFCSWWIFYQLITWVMLSNASDLGDLVSKTQLSAAPILALLRCSYIFVTVASGFFMHFLSQLVCEAKNCKQISYLCQMLFSKVFWSFCGKQTGQFLNEFWAMFLFWARIKKLGSGKQRSVAPVELLESNQILPPQLFPAKSCLTSSVCGEQSFLSHL